MNHTLIRGGTILAVDSKLPDAFVGDLLYDGDGTIIAVGPRVDVPLGATVLDATGMIVMPGLIDSHRHPWQTLMRGLSTDQTVVQYRRFARSKLGARHRPEDVYAATLLADLEALNSGVTTVADLAHIMNSPAHADAAIEAHRTSGQRVLFSYGPPNDDDASSWYQHSDRGHPQDIRRIRSDVLDDDSALVTLGMFIRPPFLVTREVLDHDLRLGRELGLHLSMDGGLGGGCWGPGRWGDKGLQPVQDIDSLNQLGPHLTLVHCNNLRDEDFKLIAETGTHVSISPDHEMNCGHGLPATKNLLRFGIEPGLSIDSVIAVSGDMFSAMRSLLSATRGAWADWEYAQGGAVNDWEIVSADVLRFATARSAAACGLGDRIGSLTPGKRADIIMLKSDPFNLTMLNNPVATVVTTAHPGNVDTVIVDGRIVKRGGSLLFNGVEDVLTNAERSRAYIMKEGSEMPTINEDASQWSLFS